MFDDINYDMDGYSYGVLPDVSRGEPSMQPTTPTGLGSGYYVDNSWTNGILGTVGKAVDYAIYRDQRDMAQKTGMVYGATPVQPTPQAAAAMQNSRLLLLGLVAVGLAFAFKGK